MKGTINCQTIVGNVGRKKVVGKIAEIAVATTGEQGTEWHDVKLISEHLVKLVSERVEKGMLIYVSGETYTEKWNDRDGVVQQKKRVLGRQIEILNWNSGKKDADKKEEASK